MLGTWLLFEPRLLLLDPRLVLDTQLLFETWLILEVLRYMCLYNALCCRLIKAELKMSLKTVHLRALSQLTPPDCYLFDLEVSFEAVWCVNKLEHFVLYIATIRASNSNFDAFCSRMICLLWRHLVADRSHNKKGSNCCWNVYILSSKVVIWLICCWAVAHFCRWLTSISAVYSGHVEHCIQMFDMPTIHCSDLRRNIFETLQLLD